MRRKETVKHKREHNEMINSNIDIYSKNENGIENIYCAICGEKIGEGF